jgi:hypothetical protein
MIDVDAEVDPDDQLKERIVELENFIAVAASTCKDPVLASMANELLAKSNQRRKRKRRKKPSTQLTLPLS